MIKKEGKNKKKELRKEESKLNNINVNFIFNPDVLWRTDS